MNSLPGFEGRNGRRNGGSALVMLPEGDTHAPAALVAEMASVIRDNIQHTNDNLQRLRKSNIDATLSYEPTDPVGGDIVDALALHDGRTLLVVADTSGHGYQAAPRALRLHGILHAAVHSTASLSELMGQVNASLLECDSCGFVTMVCAAIDPNSPNRVEIMNAGHPSPLILSRSGSLRTVNGSDNPILGIVPSVSFSSHLELLHEAEMLVMFTDGWTDVRGKCNDSLIRTLSLVYPSSPNLTAGQLAKRLSAFEHGSDDRSLLLVRRLGTSL